MGAWEAQGKGVTGRSWAGLGGPWQPLWARPHPACACPLSLSWQEVEPMCKESDHIHIIALAQALNVSILVEYMDRGEGGTTNPHVFPEGSEPKVYLLYLSLIHI